MPTRTETLLLSLSPERARGACRAALSPEIWELEEDRADRLVAREWPWRTNCQTRPARLEISIDSEPVQATWVRLQASAAGLGPVPARHLCNHLEGLIAAILEGAAHKDPP
jgi:hypothetical protein